MATTEERFASLESFRTETLHAYKDMAYEMAILKGLTNDTIGRLAALQRDVSEIKTTVNEHTELLREIIAKLDERK